MNFATGRSKNDIRLKISILSRNCLYFRNLFHSVSRRVEKILISLIVEIRDKKHLDIRSKDVQNQCCAVGSAREREREREIVLGLRVNRVVAKQASSSRWLLDLSLYSSSLSLFFFFPRARERTRPA